MQIGRKQDHGSIWIPSTPLPHMVQLDALRAFAVLAVLVAHFPPSPTLLPPLRLLDLGGLGVRLFFVISGFLITGILLTSKNHLERNDVSIFYALRQFYLRRTLRIFPLFYFVLGLAALFNIPPVRETGLWHAAYLTNFYLFFKGWDGSINHFWSLAVEEQFYLVWPWIILLVNRRRLPATILAIIAIGPIFRLLCGFYTGNDRTPVLPLSCLDTLGVGALLALRKDRIGNPQFHKYPFGKTGLFLGFVVLTVFVLLRAMNHGRMIGYAMFDMGTALIAGWMVWNASIGIGGPIGKFLEIKPLLYLGTISYGIYVYHSFAYYLFLRYLMHLPMMQRILVLPDARVLDSLLICGITISMAVLSWHLFERPINSLKRYFKYYEDRAPKRAALSE